MKLIDLMPAGITKEGLEEFNRSYNNSKPVLLLLEKYLTGRLKEIENRLSDLEKLESASHSALIGLLAIRKELKDLLNLI